MDNQRTLRSSTELAEDFCRIILRLCYAIFLSLCLVKIWIDAFLNFFLLMKNKAMFNLFQQIKKNIFCFRNFKFKTKNFKFKRYAKLQNVHSILCSVYKKWCILTILTSDVKWWTETYNVKGRSFELFWDTFKSLFQTYFSPMDSFSLFNVGIIPLSNSTTSSLSSFEHFLGGIGCYHWLLTLGRLSKSPLIVFSRRLYSLSVLRERKLKSPWDRCLVFWTVFLRFW